LDVGRGGGDTLGEVAELGCICIAGSRALQITAAFRLQVAQSARDVFFLLMLLIRPAAIDDVPVLRTLIRELAAFERELESCVIEEAELARDGFGPNPRFRALIAEWEGQTAGYALFFGYYSTWVGRGLFLEDIFVREQFRGRGIGKALLASVARIAVQEECYGVQWEVLDWNEKAIELYKSLRAEFRDRWRPVMLSDDALRRLAEKAL
jgi:GNAT superfamily N-acetyltransferase